MEKNLTNMVNPGPKQMPKPNLCCLKAELKALRRRLEALERVPPPTETCRQFRVKLCRCVPDCPPSSTGRVLTKLDDNTVCWNANGGGASCETKRGWFWDTELITDLHDYAVDAAVTGGGNTLATAGNQLATAVANATSGGTKPYVIEIQDSKFYQGFILEDTNGNALSNIVIRTQQGLPPATITVDPNSPGAPTAGWCVGLADGNTNILMGNLIIDGGGRPDGSGGLTMFNDVDGIDDRAPTEGPNAVMTNLRFKQITLRGCDEGVDWDEDGNNQPTKRGVIFEDCEAFECASDVSTSGGTGWGLDNVRGLVMRDCVNRESQRGFLFFNRCEDVVLIRCKGHDNLNIGSLAAGNSEGFKIDVRDFCVLLGCEAYNSQDDEGYRLDDGAKAFFLNCLANGNAKDGWLLEDPQTSPAVGPSTAVLINCISTNNGQSSTGYGLRSKDTGIIYEAYTCLDGNSSGPTQQDGSPIGNIVQRPEKQVLADPLFVSPATGNFQLQAGSPCLGVGRYGTDLGVFPPSQLDRCVPFEEIDRLRLDSSNLLAQTYWNTFFTRALEPLDCA